MSVAEVDMSFRAVRSRLRNPANAVRDDGIDLKRRVIPIVPRVQLVPEPEPDRRPWWLDDLIQWNGELQRISGTPKSTFELPRLMTVREVINSVARHYRVSVLDIMSERRAASIVRPRQMAMYLAKTLTTRSLTEIGRLFGGRDHTTVLHSTRKITALRMADPQVDQTLRALEAELRA